jgi:hypothetical protein
MILQETFFARIFRKVWRAREQDAIGASELFPTIDPIID